MQTSSKPKVSQVKANMGVVTAYGGNDSRKRWAFSRDLKPSTDCRISFSSVFPAHIPSWTLHHPANMLYSIIILSHPFSTPGHFSSHVFQPSHINHCTTSLEWPTTWTPHHFFASTAVIANHKTSSSSASSIRHPQGLPLKIKISSLQTLLYPNPSDHSPPHLNNTHPNSYSAPSWYSGNRTWASLDPPLIRHSAHA